jgi:hypothetical protein
MAKLSFSEQLFAGAIIYFAEYASGTSDAATKPAAENAAWKQIGMVDILKHNPKNYTEEYSELDPNLGWIDRKFEATLADLYDLTSRETTELHHRLDFGVVNAMVQGTAQAMGAKPERMVRGWIKVQLRQTGAPAKDRVIWDRFVEVRLKDSPAAEKKIQVPVLELWCLPSTLNSVVLPTAA